MTVDHDAHTTKFLVDYFLLRIRKAAAVRKIATGIGSGTVAVETTFIASKTPALAKASSPNVVTPRLNMYVPSVGAVQFQIVHGVAP